MKINPELKKILSQSSFKVVPGSYVYVKAKKRPADAKYFAIIEDAEEVTIVTSREEAKALDYFEISDKDYCLIALNVAVPFYSVGFLAAVSETIAQAGLNILIISTFSKDYILVKSDACESAFSQLKKIGLNNAR